MKQKAPLQKKICICLTLLWGPHCGQITEPLEGRMVLGKNIQTTMVRKLVGRRAKLTETVKVGGVETGVEKFA